MTDYSKAHEAANLPLQTHPELLLNMEDPHPGIVLKIHTPLVTERLSEKDVNVDAIDSWPRR